MISRRILAAVALLCAFAMPAHAQKTKAQLNSEITANYPDNSAGAITPAILRTTTSDIVNSIMPTAPVVGGNLACFSGTTGLLQDCGSAPTANAITALTGDITATGPGSVAATLATVNSNVGSFGSATAAPAFTVDGKGRITAASTNTVTPAVGSITGLGTGIATALAATPTGSGSVVLATSPTLTTPTIGAATATSVNKVTITAPATSATITIANGTTLTETTTTSVGQGQYLGEASTGNATAGNIGEYTDNPIVAGSAVPLVSTTPKTIASITIAAGDWDVSATFYAAPAATTSMTQDAASVSTTTNTLDTTTPGRFTQRVYTAVVPAGFVQIQAIAPQRFSVSGSTTIFLVGQATFTVSTLSGYGTIRARRVR